jgi:hypothetical protein
MARNGRHFGQAQGTPFTQSPITELINWSADTETAELILSGEYNPDKLDDVSQLLLRHCASVTKLETIQPTITMEDVLGKNRVWCKGTSTSPSGRHLGHYKTLAAPIKHACDPDEQYEVDAHRQDLLQAQLHVINYCLIHGYSLRRWQRVVNVMIHKEAGNHKIHRLRVIHLFEADYNLILSIKWRQQI